MRYILFALAGYFLGAVRFSYLIPKWLCDVDVTAVSKDKNAGTANAMKYAGVPVGILCLFLDMGKGFLPVFLAARLADVQSLAFAAVVTAPILGHCFPVYHSFHGGKAVAVSFGVLIGLMWDNLLVFGLVFWYLFTCLLRFVRPNEKKSVLAFLLFGLTVLVFGMIHMIPLGICLGLHIGCIAVIYRNAIGLVDTKKAPLPDVSPESEPQPRDAV